MTTTAVAGSVPVSTNVDPALVVHPETGATGMWLDPAAAARVAPPVLAAWVAAGSPFWAVAVLDRLATAADFDATFNGPVLALRRYARQ